MIRKLGERMLFFLMHSHPLQGERRGGGGLVISVFSRPDTGCIVKGQDRAGRIFFPSFPTSVGSTYGWHGCIIGAWLLNVVETGRGCR